MMTYQRKSNIILLLGLLWSQVEAFRPSGARAKSPPNDPKSEDPFVVPTEDVVTEDLLETPFEQKIMKTVVEPPDDKTEVERRFRIAKSTVTPFTTDNLKNHRAPISTDNIRNWIPWHQGEAIVPSSSIDPTTSNRKMEAYIRNEYNIWLQDYNKESDEAHYQTFKRNFLMLLEESDDGEGGQRLFHMNQFGDMHHDEAQREIILLEAYTNWCAEYQKVQDPQKFELFKMNLLQQVRNLSIDQEITLDENADQVASLEFYIDPLLKEVEHASQRRRHLEGDEYTAKVQRRQSFSLHQQERQQVPPQRGVRSSGGFVQSRASQIEQQQKQQQRYDRPWYERQPNHRRENPNLHP